jgi:TolB-like protein
VAIGHRAAAVLAALALARGEAVFKADLLSEAWPGVIVEEGNLAVQVAGLRKAMGRGPDGRDWIVTVPRLGYRLAAPDLAPSPVDVDGPVLAVLPFQVLGGAEGDGYFADGVAEDIIAALGHFRSFTVLSGSTSFLFRDREDPRAVARDLGARYLLHGSVRRAGERLRIGAELTDAVAGAHLWAETYDGPVDEVFDFQDHITESVATVIEPQIQAAELARARRERPGSVAGYDVPLQARARILAETPAENAAAHALLTQALALDPHNPRILAHAVWVIEHRTSMGWPPFGPDDVARCAGYVRRALERAAGDPAVMAPCGIALIQTVKDDDWGLAVLRAAAGANPNDLVAAMMAGVGEYHCGDLDVALAHFARALRLSPHGPFVYVSCCGIADVHMARGAYAEAAEWANRSLGANPNFDPTFWNLIAANAHLGRMAAARRHLAELRRLRPGITLARIRAGQPECNPARKAATYDGLRLAGLEED